VTHVFALISGVTLNEVKFTLQQATKAQKGSKGVVLLFL